MGRLRIKRFLDATRLRLNLRLVLAESGPALLVCGTVSVCAALYFVTKGEAVAPPWLLLGPLAGLLVLFFKLASQFHSVRSAAAAADRLFNLKDSLVSFLDFEAAESRDPFHLLLVAWSSARCRALRPSEALPFFIPWGHYLCAGLFLVLCVWLCSFGESPRVAGERRAAELSLERSAVLAKELQREMEKFKDSLDVSEREAFARSELAKAIDAMKATSDPREALRGYSRAAAELSTLLDKERLREDARLLSDAGKSMKEEPATAELGARFEEGDFKGSAARLSEMAASLSKNGRNAASDAAKLSSAASKLEREASKREALKSSLKDSIGKMASAASELRRRSSKDAAGKTASYSELGVAAELLKRDIQGLDARLAFAAKASSLEDALREAEFKLASSDGPPSKGESQEKGAGKGIGSAPDGSLNNADPASFKRSYDTALKGLPGGKGASTGTLMDAASGSGTSSASASAKDVDFKRQYETFIRREDMPESMKGAVKIYFNSLHNEGN